MKNLLESFAILLVGILSLGIVYLIIEYNMIDDKNIVEAVDESAYATQVNDDLDDDLDEDEDLEEDEDLDE